MVKSPIQEAVDTNKAQIISAALQTSNYVDIMAVLPTIQLDNTKDSIQLAVAQTANFNAITNPGAAQILTKALSKVHGDSARQEASVWVTRLFKAFEHASSDTALTVLNQAADVCKAASEVTTLQLPATLTNLLLTCNALESTLTVSPRVSANVESALNRVETMVKPQKESEVALPALCNLVTKFPVYIHVNTVVQYLLGAVQRQPTHVEIVQRAMSTVAIERIKSDQSPSPVFVPHLTKPLSLAGISKQLVGATVFAVTSAVVGTSALLAAAFVGPFVGPVAGLGVLGASAYAITQYLNIPTVFQAASTPTMVSRVQVMNNPYCTHLARYDMRLRQALESTKSLEQLVYDETSETCSMLYALVGKKAPPGVSVADAIATVQAELPLEPDFSLHAAAFQAQATFITNVTNANNADLTSATLELLECMPEQQADKLAALSMQGDVAESFTEWQAAQTMLVEAHQNGTLSKDMITPIGELYKSFVSTLQSNAEEKLTTLTLETSAMLNQTIVTDALNVIEKAQALSEPDAAPLSGLMVSETPRAFTWDDLIKPNWLQRTCNFVSKNMTDSAEGTLVIDKLPTKSVPNLNSPWTLVPRDGAFLGVARLNKDLIWVNATCTDKGGVTMIGVDTPSKTSGFMDQCPMVVDEEVPDMAWNVTSDFTIDKPEELKKEIGKQPTCVFVPYSWALPSTATTLTKTDKQFFEKVYSHVTFEFEGKPTAFAMKNTVAPLVASAGIGSVTEAISNVAGYALLSVVRSIESVITDKRFGPPDTTLTMQQRRIGILEKRIAQLNLANAELNSGDDEIKSTSQYEKTKAWISQEHKSALAQIQSAKAELKRMVGGGPMAREQVLL